MEHAAKGYTAPICQVFRIEIEGPVCASARNESFDNDMNFDWNASLLGVSADFNLIWCIGYGKSC